MNFKFASYYKAESKKAGKNYHEVTKIGKRTHGIYFMGIGYHDIEKDKKPLFVNYGIAEIPSDISDSKDVVELTIAWKDTRGGRINQQLKIHLARVRFILDSSTMVKEIIKESEIAMSEKGRICNNGPNKFAFGNWTSYNPTKAEIEFFKKCGL